MEVYRKEIKNVISVQDFFRLRKYLEYYIEADKYSGDTGYTVRSLYFDSYNDRDLFDVLDGLHDKRKIRLRIYSVNDSNVKLEYKCKSGSDSRKFALLISREEALSMVEGDYSFLLGKKDPLALQLYSRLNIGAYRPTIIVDYKRLAYTYLPNDVRITFDSSITSSPITSGLFDSNAAWQPVMPPGIGVLEVKYNEFLFEYLKKAIEEVDSLPTSNSKYANSRLFSDF